MEMPLQVTFRNMKHSHAIEKIVSAHCDKLSRYCDGITSCRVNIEVPHKHHQNGNPFRVRIDLTVPGAELVVETKLADNSAYEDLKVALRDAFDMARRRLEDYARRRRGMVKSRVAVDHTEEAELREIEREQREEFLNSQA